MNSEFEFDFIHVVLTCRTGAVQVNSTIKTPGENGRITKLAMLSQPEIPHNKEDDHGYSDQPDQLAHFWV